MAIKLENSELGRQNVIRGFEIKRHVAREDWLRNAGVDRVQGESGPTCRTNLEMDWLELCTQGPLSAGVEC